LSLAIATRPDITADMRRGNTKRGNDIMLMIASAGSTMCMSSLLPIPAYAPNCTIRQHTSAYVSIRQHTSACVSIRQHTSAYVGIPKVASETVTGAEFQKMLCRLEMYPYFRRRFTCIAYVSTRRHASSYVSIRQHTSDVPVRPLPLHLHSIGQHTSAYASIRQHI
jgi:hypothetical protein